MLFFGKLSPIMVPNGINPVFRPSMNTASPTTTATKPKQRVTADSIGCRKINNWKSIRYAARGATALS
jgi:hypothetical protein